jgi:hypothetical protein
MRSKRRTIGGGLLGLLLLVASTAFGAEAPVSAGSTPLIAPEPLPPEAEAAHLDAVDDQRREVWLDEAIFTEITPVTEPELGIRLPADQDH